LNRPENQSEKLPLLIDSSVTFRLAGTANRLNRSASIFYRSNFGIGVQEWRLVLVLGRRSRMMVGDAAVAADIDTAAASRALKLLNGMGYVTLEMTSSRGRATMVSLTDEGLALYRELTEAGKKRAAAILDGLSRQEVDQLNDILGRVMLNALQLLDDVSQGSAAAE
jgi:DNA-binding MarR family transcriptional regulator